ncbi:chromosome segregation protein SMC [Persicobacter diffluens]
MSNDLENTIMSEEKKGGANLMPVVIVLAVLLVASLGYIFYLHKVNTVSQEELAQSQKNVEVLQADLDNKIAEIQELGGNVEDLQAIRAQLEEEKSTLENKNSVTTRQLMEFQNKAEGYRELLLRKEKEIAKLKQINDQLVTENVELKEEKNELNRNIKNLNAEREKLNDKVAFASRLKTKDLEVFAVSDNGKEREGSEFRQRHLDKLKVSFQIAENKVAPVGGRDIMIRLIDENDNVLFDVSKGGGTFMYNGRETFYTEKQNILFDNSKQSLTFVYDKGSEYDKGKYILEVFTDDYKMGEIPFSVR